MTQEVLSQNMYDSIVKDRRIKVFLSSTFKDMSEERDYLVRNVFMELEAEALKRNVALNLLDLRWGITAEESRQGLVTEICLKEIEASRPFFIGIIGDRYGWIPSEEDFPKNCSLFESFPWVKEDIKNGLSITEIEIQYGVLRNKLPLKAFFYIKETSKNDTLDDSEEARKLRHLKEQILAQKEHPVKYYKTAEDLGELIKDDIRKQLFSLFPKIEENDIIKESAFIQESILRTKIEHYIRLKGAYEFIDDFIISPQRLLVIKGDSGTGKSSLLANWAYTRKDSHNIFLHFIDTSYNCADCDFILLRLYYYICEQLQINTAIKTDDWNNVDIKTEIEKLIESTDKQFVVIIDALNQLDNVKNAYQLEWFPKLSQHFKIICSANDDNYDIIMALGHKSAIKYEISLFRDIESFGEIINGYLRFYGKKLDEEQIQMIFENKLYTNSLLLFTLLEELRLYGDYETLNKKITYFTKASTEIEFINSVFQRLESDMSFYKAKADDIGRVLFLLAIIRNGIPNEIISQVLDLSKIYVTSFLYRCHRFISVMGQMNSISHSKIKNVILQSYIDKVGDEVISRYEDYLIRNLIDYTPNRSYLNTVLQLVYLYFHFDKKDKLHHLITSPDAFVILYKFALNELRQCYVFLTDAGFSIFPLTERLDESMLSEVDAENYIFFVLSCARKLCLSTHRFDDLSKLFVESEKQLFANPKVSIEQRVLFLCDYLKFCNYTDDNSKGLAIAEKLLQEADSLEEKDSIRALAYSQKADMLRKTDIKESIHFFNAAVEIYLKCSDFDGAIASLINAGIGLAQSGFYEDALQMYTRAQFFIEEHIKNDPGLIVQKYTCNSNIAALYGRMGDHRQKSEYQRTAIYCYLQIRGSEFEPLLSPTTIVSEQEHLGYIMMSNGELQDGLSELNGAMDKLNQYKSNISDTEYATYRFEIFMDIAKGYAINKKYAEATKSALMIDEEITKAYIEHPDSFTERYLLYIKLMADLMCDLSYYETASYYFQKSIDEFDEVIKYRKIGYNSFLADQQRLYAHCLIKKGDVVAGLINLDKASKEYDSLIVQNSIYLEKFVDTMLEYFYVTENNKNFENFSLERLEELYNNLFVKIKTNEEYYTYFTFVCIKLIFIHRRTDTILDAENYFLFLYHILDREDAQSNFAKSLYPCLAFCLDELAHAKHELRLLKDSLVFSRMALEYINAINPHFPSNVIQITHVIQHCANYHDEVGLKDQAFEYYKQAIKELDVLDEQDHNVMFRKAGILYDYGIAMYPVDIVKTEKILNESVDLYRQIYDEKSNVAIQYAYAEQALANLYDDTKRLTNAETHYRSSIHILEDFTNEPLAKSRLGVALNNYGIMLMKQERFDEAREVFLHSRDIRLESDPFGVTKTDESLYLLALCEEKEEEAYTYLKEILDIQEKYGVVECGIINEFINHTDSFAKICLMINKEEEAKLAYKKVYDMICNSLNKYMTDEMRNYKNNVKDRILELFNTTDFLIL